VFQNVFPALRGEPDPAAGIADENRRFHSPPFSRTEQGRDH
jgi:hypothetical protein